MNIELNQQEIWKILDALAAYKKDYAVSAVVTKTLGNLKTNFQKVKID